MTNPDSQAHTTGVGVWYFQLHQQSRAHKAQLLAHCTCTRPHKAHSNQPRELRSKMLCIYHGTLHTCSYTSALTRSVYIILHKTFVYVHDLYMYTAEVMYIILVFQQHVMDYLDWFDFKV